MHGIVSGERKKGIGNRCTCIYCMYVIGCLCNVKLVRGWRLGLVVTGDARGYFTNGVFEEGPTLCRKDVDTVVAAYR
jgi:hypothetical protein